MVARVSTYRGRIDRLLDGFRRTTEPLAQLDGFERAYSSRTPNRAAR